MLLGGAVDTHTSLIEMKRNSALCSSMFLEKKMYSSRLNNREKIMQAHKFFLTKSLDRVSIIETIINLLLNRVFSGDECEVNACGYLAVKVSAVMKLIRQNYDILSDIEIDLVMKSFDMPTEDVRREHLRQPRLPFQSVYSESVVDSSFGPGYLYELGGICVAGRIGRGPVAWYRGENGIWNPTDLSAEQMIASFVHNTTDIF